MGLVTTTETTMSEKVDINQLHDEFNQECKHIQSLIDTSSTEDHTELKKKIIQLQNKIEEVSHLLPSYQQLSYTEQIRSLLEAVEKRNAPQKRFKFSRKPQPKKPLQKEPVNLIQEQEEIPNVAGVNRSSREIADETKIFCKDVESSILIFKNLESITLKKISNSIILIESKGPCFIFGMQNCKIFVKCHQLRIHDSNNSEIFPTIDSQNAIIEGCSNLIFKNEDIQVNDFDSPGSVSSNYTKSGIEQKDQDLCKQLQSADKLQDLLANITAFLH